ncbi:MAG: diphosphate--fructose-6-phosphate 1-phosphotransferase, partial [Chlamydiae bacterium]|nr:diphosphate--fructose-6-phosphate 1-phosphotransferase [Chlamydiota bacterium]
MELSLLAKARQKYQLQLPTLLQELDQIAFSKKPMQTPDSVKEYFPNTKGYPLLKGEKRGEKRRGRALKVGVVLSGGQASGGHNVIIGLFEALKQIHPESVLLGFLEGPSGIIEGRFKLLERKELDNYRNSGGFDLIGSGRT